MEDRKNYSSVITNSFGNEFNARDYSFGTEISILQEKFSGGYVFDVSYRVNIIKGIGHVWIFDGSE